MAQTQTGEEGLKVSNAPADGKFLQYKDSTDKLTWADVPAGVGGDAGAQFNDNVTVKLGDGTYGEMLIFSNGTEGVLRSGSAAGEIHVQNNGSSIETMAKFIGDGAVELNHNNVKKFETTATGITVSGVVAATTLTGDGSALTGIASTSLDGCGYQNDQTISAGSYSIAAGKGMHSVGPITNNGTVTVSGTWVIS